MYGLHGRFALIARSATEVNRAILFSAAIIIAGFVPLFTMTGIEGHIFGPMAKTYAYAIAGGLIATFTVSPALASFLLDKQVEETETAIVKWLRIGYAPLIRFALANRVLVLGAAAVIVIFAALLVRQLGLEFLPKLEEGNLWIRATMPVSISLEEGNAYVNRMRRIIKSYPEVQTVVSQHGRPDDGTDATGFFNAEFFVPLYPFDTWKSGIDKEELTRRMTAELQKNFAGVEFNFSQYIQDNVEEAASGVKGENSVKLFGNDLAALEANAEKVRQALATVPGIEDLAVFKSLGQPTIRVDIDRKRAARYGLATGDINATIQAAIGGQSPGDVFEEGSDRHFAIMVRFAPEYRSSVDAIRRITIGAPSPTGNGTIQVPLGDVADVRLVSGASFVYREQQERYVPIKFSVRGRDLGTVVLEGQEKVREQVHLPPGYRLEWVGEFGNLQDALQRLSVIVPLSILLIAVLLYVNFGSIRDVLLAISVIPMALVGGVLALWVTGTPFSVSAAIGFVALFGIAVMDGIIVISYFNLLIEDGAERGEAILRACEVQMRPVLMTCIVACAGLIPAALSTGIGSQVQRPLALVVVGGILLAPLLILVVLPVLIVKFSGRGLVIAAAALIAGCAAGPDYVKPANPEVAQYLSQPLADRTDAAPEAQRFVQGDVPEAWWQLFRSPGLDAMVESALKANPGVEAAEAALRAARENTAAGQGAFYPQVNASYTPTRQKVADPLTSPLTSGSTLFTLHTAQLNIAYTFDLFGANRRTVEGLEAQEQFARFQRDAALLTLTTNVVAGAIQEASLRGQVEATRKVIDIEAEQVEILSKQLELGAIAEVNVIAQRTALAQAQAALPQLEKQLGQQRNALAVLVGRYPSDEPQERFELASLSLPQELPLSLPSSLVDRRPDVRAAEAELHAASAQVGVATANMLPQITLAANGGSVAEQVAHLFTAPGSFWTVGAGLTQPIFEGGTLLHRKRAAEAAYDQAAAQYRATVLTAFQNVADALTALQADARATSAALEAERLASESLDITRKQLALGDVGYLALLNAEQAYRQALIARIQAQASRYSDTVALFQALGGGWRSE
jgi:NodT family efflux transporter outer membrane factor (OMF) lipoprotein